MTVESDILAVLEERSPRLAIDIAAALPHRNKGSVMTTIALMVKQKRLTKNVDGRVGPSPENTPTVEAPKPWRAARLAPYQRVTLYLKACGPKSKDAVMAMLTDTGVSSPKEVLHAMTQEGTVHTDAQDQVCLGPRPKTPEPAKSAATASRGSVPPKAAKPAEPATGIWKNPAPQPSERIVPAGVDVGAILDDTHVLDQEPAMAQKEPSSPPPGPRPSAPPPPPRPGQPLDVQPTTDVYTILGEAFARCQREHGVVLTEVRFELLDVSTMARTEYAHQCIHVDSIAVRSRRGEA